MKKKDWLAAAIIVGGVAVVWWAADQRNNGKASEPTAQTAPSDIGQRGYLVSGSETTFIGKTEVDYDEFSKAAQAKDEVGFRELVRSQRLLPIKSGTSVLVIDRSMFMRKVRILDGPFKDEAGWCPVERVKGTPQ